VAVHGLDGFVFFALAVFYVLDFCGFPSGGFSVLKSSVDAIVGHVVGGLFRASDSWVQHVSFVFTFGCSSGGIWIWFLLLRFSLWGLVWILIIGQYMIGGRSAVDAACFVP